MFLQGGFEGFRIYQKFSGVGSLKNLNIFAAAPILFCQNEKMFIEAFYQQSFG